MAGGSVWNNWTQRYCLEKLRLVQLVKKLGDERNVCAWEEGLGEGRSGLCSSQHIARVRWARWMYVTFMGQKSNSYKYFFRKLEGKRLLLRTRGKWNLFKCTKRGKEVVDWLRIGTIVGLLWDLFTAWATIRFSGRTFVSGVGSTRRAHINCAVYPGLCVCVCVCVCVLQRVMHTWDVTVTSNVTVWAISAACLSAQNPFGGPPTLL